MLGCAEARTSAGRVRAVWGAAGPQVASVRWRASRPSADAGEEVDDFLLGGALGGEAPGPLHLGDVVAAGNRVDAKGGDVAVDGERRFDDGVAVVALRLVETDQAFGDDVAVMVGQAADAAALECGAHRDVREPVRECVEAADEGPDLVGEAGTTRETDVWLGKHLREAFITCFGCR